LARFARSKLAGFGGAMGILRRVGNLFSRARVGREIDEEISAHLALRAEDNLAAGMSEREALRDARVRFGNPVVVRERTMAADAALLIESFWADVRYACRGLRRTPGFAGTAIVVLALGVCASLAIFAFMDAVLIRPLPYKDPARLVGLYETTPLGPRYHLSYLDYQDWKKMNTVFTGIEAFDDRVIALKTAAGLERVDGALVSAGFLRLLGVSPALGRDMRDGEDARGAARVALLSDAAWQQRFGGRRDVLGQTVTLDGAAYEIVGVLPRDFNFAGVGDAEFWVPLTPAAKEDRGEHWFSAIGRMKDGVALKAAQTEMAGIATRLAREYPDTDGGRGASVEAWTEVVVGDLRPMLMLLMAGSVLLLGMACVNVSSLLLVRCEKRRTEIAVRGALGATRGRLARQFVTEGLVLAGAGCALGVGAADIAMRLLGSLVPMQVLETMPYLRELGLGWHVAGFALLIALLTAALFALTPVVRMAALQSGQQGGMTGEMASGGRGTAGLVWRRLGSNLVILELAAAMVLLTGAGLLGKSFYRLLHAELGMEPGHLALVKMRIPQTAELAKDAQVVAFEQRVIEEVKRLPGVESAATVPMPPVADMARGNTTFTVVGRPKVKSEPDNEATMRNVSPGFFSTVGARLERGRYFAETDTTDRPAVAIVNRALAKRFFPGEDAMGMQIRFDAALPPVMIVGVVADLRETALDGEIPPTVYVPFAQWPDPGFYVVARTANDPKGVLKAIEGTLRGMDPGVLILGSKTMEERIAGTTTAVLHKALARLVAGFAGLALVLSVVGLYGVIAYSVAQRTREIGVRMALGAQRGAVAGMVLREAGWLTVIGLGAGMACAVGAATLMRKLLFGVSSWDVSTLISVGALLAVAALLASYLPARRAAGVNPVDALRAE